MDKWPRVDWAPRPLDVSVTFKQEKGSVQREGVRFEDTFIKTAWQHRMDRWENARPIRMMWGNTPACCVERKNAGQNVRLNNLGLCL